MTKLSELKANCIEWWEMGSYALADVEDFIDEAFKLGQDSPKENLDEKKDTCKI
jgi:hypothetical protein